MKANVPKKLYLTSNENGAHYYTEGIPFEREYIEYTRTDSFIDDVEEFLIDNLKELPMGNGKFKLKTECSLEEFLEKIENYIKEIEK